MLNIGKHLEKISLLESQIYKTFSYNGDWRVYPINNCLDYYWISDKNKVYFVDVFENINEKLLSNKDFSLNQLTEFVIDEELYTYSELIIKELGNSKCNRYTAFIIDTQCDGNKFFSIFTNKNNYYDMFKSQQNV